MILATLVNTGYNLERAPFNSGIVEPWLSMVLKCRWGIYWFRVTTCQPFIKYEDIGAKSDQEPSIKVVKSRMSRITPFYHRLYTLSSSTNLSHLSILVYVL